MTELVDPLETQLLPSEKKNYGKRSAAHTNGGKQIDTAGGAVASAQPIKVCSQNQDTNIVRKRHHSSHNISIESSKETTSSDTYNAGNKTVKKTRRNKSPSHHPRLSEESQSPLHSSPSKKVVARSGNPSKINSVQVKLNGRIFRACKKTQIEASVRNAKSHDELLCFEESTSQERSQKWQESQESQSPSNNSNQSVATRSNVTLEEGIGTRQNERSSCNESILLVIPNSKIEILKTASSSFQKRFQELLVFKAKFGHCNVTQSRSTATKPYFSLAQWCYEIRRSRRLTEEGKQPSRTITKDLIHLLDFIGFLWIPVNKTFEERIVDLRAFKAKFGHCNVTQSKTLANKPYLTLAHWTYGIRQSRRMVEQGKPISKYNLSKAQIEVLDEIGFLWEPVGIFKERIEELRAFKATFGHCNVTRSASAANKQFIYLARWCSEIRRSRRLMDEGKTPSKYKLSKARIEVLDDIGFLWK